MTKLFAFCLMEKIFTYNRYYKRASAIILTNKDTIFTFHKSFFVDDAAFLLLLRDNIERAVKLVSNQFWIFGLITHSQKLN